MLNNRFHFGQVNGNQSETEMPDKETNTHTHIKKFRWRRSRKWWKGFSSHIEWNLFLDYLFTEHEFKILSFSLLPNDPHLLQLHTQSSNAATFTVETRASFYFKQKKKVAKVLIETRCHLLFNFKFNLASQLIQTMATIPQFNDKIFTMKLQNEMKK